MRNLAQEFTDNLHSVTMDIYPDGLDHSEFVKKGKDALMTFSDKGYMCVITDENIQNCTTINLRFCKPKGNGSMVGNVYLNKSHVISTRKHGNKYYIYANIPKIEQEIAGKKYTYVCRDISKLINVGRSKRTNREII